MQMSIYIDYIDQQKGPLLEEAQEDVSAVLSVGIMTLYQLGRKSERRSSPGKSSSMDRFQVAGNSSNTGI